MRHLSSWTHTLRGTPKQPQHGSASAKAALARRQPGCSVPCVPCPHNVCTVLCCARCAGVPALILDHDHDSLHDLDAQREQAKQVKYCIYCKCAMPLPWRAAEGEERVSSGAGAGKLGTLAHRCTMCSCRSPLRLLIVHKCSALRALLHSPCPLHCKLHGQLHCKRGEHGTPEQAPPSRPLKFDRPLTPKQPPLHAPPGRCLNPSRT